MQSQAVLRGLEEAASRAAVSSRHWPALVVDGKMRLCNANAEGDKLLSAGSPVRCINGVVSFHDTGLSRSLAQSIAGLAASATALSSICASTDRLNPMAVEISRLPRTHRLFKPLIRERTQLLLQIKQLSMLPAQPDLSPFGTVYGLTKGEVRLCAALYSGMSLREATLKLDVTYETVRSRMKIVFAKTGTNSQAELAALLSRFAL